MSVPLLVLGLDPSLLGYGVSDGVTAIAISTPSGMHIYDRMWIVQRAIADFVQPRIGDGRALFVIEAPMKFEGANHLLEVGHLMAATYDVAWSMFSRERVDVIEVPRAKWVKFVTGKGNTPKAELPLKVFRKWDVSFDDDPKQDKLVAYCLHRYGLAVHRGEIVHEEPKARGRGADASATTRRAHRTHSSIGS